MADRPQLSVVVPVRNGAATIGACLEALAAQRDAPPFEVVVVDNASTDGTADLVRGHPLAPRLVAEPRVGSYAARNRGLDVATGRWLAFTDADCRPEADWLAVGARALADWDLVAGRVRPIAHSTATVWERYDRALYLRQEEFVHRDGFAATANLLCRADAFARVGRFDAALVSSGDMEWCGRARAAGLRLGFEPAAVVWHQPRRTAGQTWRLHRRLGAGWAQLAKRGQRPGPWWHDPALFLELGAVVDAVAADGPRLRFRQLAPVHGLATAARVVGRLTGRA